MTSPHEWYGCIPDVLDRRDRNLALLVPRDFPSAVDLRQWMPPVMDQSSLGSCTANGVTAAARYYIIKRGTTYDFEMSRLQLYYDSRDLEGTTTSDAGAQIRDVIKTLAKKGVGHEELWPYDISKFDQKPPQEVYDDAVQYLALTYERVPVTNIGLKTALVHGHPVIIGISVYESFESYEVESSGMVPMPEDGEAMVGGHCMCVVGYGQQPGHFTVRNSWGKYWGKEGDCFIPEQYLGSQVYGADYWAIDVFGSQAEKDAGMALASSETLKQEEPVS